MAIIIKKITARTFFSFAAACSFVYAVLVRFFVGGGDMNLSKLEAVAMKKVHNLGMSIPVARADVPAGGDSGGSGDGANGGDSGGSGSGGSDGSGGGDGW